MAKNATRLSIQPNNKENFIDYYEQPITTLRFETNRNL